MKFAHFSHVWEKPGMTPLQRYEQEWRELEICDLSGFDFAFCVEHHFCPDESWMSAPSIYVAAAAARTRNIRIGAMGHNRSVASSVASRRGNCDHGSDEWWAIEVGLVPGGFAELLPIRSVRALRPNAKRRWSTLTS